MELALRQAKARLSELVTAAQGGKRVIITKHGQPAVEIVRFRTRGGIDFEKLEQARQRLGVANNATDWPREFDDPAFSRKVLGTE